MTTAYQSSYDRKVYGGSIMSVSFYDLTLPPLASNAAGHSVIHFILCRPGDMQPFCIDH